MRTLTVLLALLVLPLTMKAGSKDELSSKSAVERLSDVEKENKGLLKELKKAYYQSVKGWVERWTDGRIYYILRTLDKRITIIRDGKERIFYGPNDKPGDDNYYFFYDSIELTEREGKPFFLVNGNTLYSYNGELIGQDAVVKTFDGKKYFNAINRWGSNTDYNLTTIEGKPIFKNVDEYWFFPASDRSLCRIGDFSFPAMPLKARFMSLEKNKNNNRAEDRYEIRTPDGEKINSYIKQQALIGNAYYAARTNEVMPVRTQFITDTSINVSGNKINNRLFRVEGQDLGYPAYDYHNNHYCDVRLFKADGTLLLDSLAWADFSSKDQVIYYYKENNERAIRCGALNPLYPELNVPPLFAEIDYIPDGSGISKPWVRLTSFGQWEPYDPQKKYDYSSLSKNQRMFEKNDFNFYCHYLKETKAEDMTDEEKVMYIYAAGMVGNKVMHDQQKIMNNYYNGIAPTKEDESSYSFQNSFLLNGYNERDYLHRSCELIDYMEKHTDKRSEKYQLVQGMKDYSRYLNKVVAENYETHIPEAKSAYSRYEAQQRLAKALEEERRAEAQSQKMNSLALIALNAFGNVINTLVQGSSHSANKPLVKSSGIRVVKEHTGHKMLDGMKVPDSFNYLPVYTGSSDMEMPASSTWQQSSGNNSSAAGSTSSSSSTQRCRLCLSHPGKCNLCAGRGQYIPSVSVGHYIKCDKCNGTGTCPSCHGSGAQ